MTQQTQDTEKKVFDNELMNAVWVSGRNPMQAMLAPYAFFLQFSGMGMLANGVGQTMAKVVETNQQIARSMFQIGVRN